jgi:hypothetical protein
MPAPPLPLGRLADLPLHAALLESNTARLPPLLHPLDLDFAIAPHPPQAHAARAEQGAARRSWLSPAAGRCCSPRGRAALQRGMCSDKADLGAGSGDGEKERLRAANAAAGRRARAAEACTTAA